MLLRLFLVGALASLFLLRLLSPLPTEQSPPSVVAPTPAPLALTAGAWPPIGPEHPQCRDTLVCLPGCRRGRPLVLRELSLVATKDNQNPNARHSPWWNGFPRAVDANYLYQKNLSATVAYICQQNAAVPLPPRVAALAGNASRFGSSVNQYFAGLWYASNDTACFEGAELCAPQSWTGMLSQVALGFHDCIAADNCTDIASQRAALARVLNFSVSQGLLQGFSLALRGQAGSALYPNATAPAPLSEDFGLRSPVPKPEWALVCGASLSPDEFKYLNRSFYENVNMTNANFMPLWISSMRDGDWRSQEDFRVPADGGSCLSFIVPPEYPLLCGRTGRTQGSAYECLVPPFSLHFTLAQLRTNIDRSGWIAMDITANLEHFWLQQMGDSAPYAFCSTQFEATEKDCTNRKIGDASCDWRTGTPPPGATPVFEDWLWSVTSGGKMQLPDNSTACCSCSNG